MTKSLQQRLETGIRRAVAGWLADHDPEAGVTAPDKNGMWIGQRKNLPEHLRGKEATGCPMYLYGTLFPNHYWRGRYEF